MRIFKKFFEYVEATEEEQPLERIESDDISDLQAKMDELKRNKGGQFVYNGYKISLPSELNDFSEMGQANEGHFFSSKPVIKGPHGEEMEPEEDEDSEEYVEEREPEETRSGYGSGGEEMEPKTDYKFLVISPDDKHAQASEEDVKKLVKEQILFESYRQRSRLRKRK
jgi:hypothetical protein